MTACACKMRAMRGAIVSAGFAFLLGSCGGALKTGQHIHLENEPHNKLLVTLMNAMGVAGNQFGDPTFGTGPLPGVSAT